MAQGCFPSLAPPAPGGTSTALPYAVCGFLILFNYFHKASCDHLESVSTSHVTDFAGFLMKLNVCVLCSTNVFGHLRVERILFPVCLLLAQTHG